jgi:hypothetical protein
MTRFRGMESKIHLLIGHIESDTPTKKIPKSKSSKLPFLSPIVPRKHRERENLREKVTFGIRVKPSSLNNIAGAPLSLDEIGTQEGLGRLGVWDLVGKRDGCCGFKLARRNF